MNSHKSQIKEVFPLRSLSKNGDLVEERRDYIMRCSTKLFTKKGYERTTTRELVQACNMSTGALYHYFGSKEELLYYIINNATKMQVKYLERFADDLETTEPATGLVQLIRKFFEWHDKNQDITVFIYQETKNLPTNARQDIFDSETRIHDLFERLLRKGMESGEFSTDEPGLIAHTVMMLGHSWALRRWYLRKHWTLETYIKHQAAAILKAIQASVKV